MHSDFHEARCLICQYHRLRIRFVYCPGHKKRFPVLLKQEKDNLKRKKEEEEADRKRKKAEEEDEEADRRRKKDEKEEKWKRKQAEEEDKERLARARRRKEIEAAEASPDTNEPAPALHANDSGSTSANSQGQVATNAKALPANKEFHYFASHKVSNTCYCYAFAHQNESNQQFSHCCSCAITETPHSSLKCF